MTLNKSIFFCTVLFACFLFPGCTKNPEPLTPLQQAAQNLVGNGNKTWHLQELYINTVSQVLSPQQKAFSKIYTLNAGSENSGIVITSEGKTGRWRMPTEEDLKEIIDHPTGPISIDYIITEMSVNRMDVYYVSNLVLTREVYYAD